MMKIDTQYLNGTRFVLALWVGVVHFFNRAGSGIITFPFQKFILNGGAAVDGFMVITGFLMAFNYIQRSSKESPSLNSTKQLFWIRRLFRLYPVYVIAILFGYLSFDFINSLTIYVNEYFYGFEKHSLTYGSEMKLDIWDLVSHLTFVHGLLPNYNMSIIGPAWSLSTEAQFYLIFPFLFLAIQKKVNLTSVLVFSAFIYIVAFKLFGFWGNGGKIVSFGAPALIIYKLMYFLLGITLAGYKLKKIGSNILLFNILLICVVEKSILSLAVTLFITILMTSDDLKPYIPKFCNSIILFAKRLLSQKWGNWGADVSYSFYIFHSPLLSVGLYLAILLGLNSKVYTAIIGFLIFLLITLSLSWIIFVKVEKPFIKFGKKVVDRIQEKFSLNSEVGN